MFNRDSSNRNLPRDPFQGSDAALLGFAGLAVLAVAAGSLWSIFAASTVAGWVALLALGLFGLVFVQVYRAQPRALLPLMLLGAGAAWTASAGFVVFDAHWLAFTPAAWVMNLLFVSALVAGAWSRLEAWLKFVAALLAAALVTATMVLPRPPGGEGPLDTAEKWKVDVEVTDAADDAPLRAARVLCATTMQWEDTIDVGDPAARVTGPDGRVDTWEFEDDTRLKIVICNAWKDADDANAGYPAQAQVIAAPAGGGEYRLRFALSENPHPDVAFLSLELDGAFANQSWFYLDFELWAGAPAADMGAREGPQPLMRKAYRELNGGFRIPASASGTPLVLRYRYEGPAAGVELGPPYVELDEILVEPVEAGTRRRLRLSIPSRQ